MTIKDIPIHELKYYYGERNGFVFSSNTSSSDRSIETLCHTLTGGKVTATLPEFVVRIDNVTTAFVYPEGESFNCPDFIAWSNNNMMFSRFWNVDSLAGYLQNKN